MCARLPWNSAVVFIYMCVYIYVYIYSFTYLYDFVFFADRHVAAVASVNARCVTLVLSAMHCCSGLALAG